MEVRIEEGFWERRICHAMERFLKKKLGYSVNLSFKVLEITKAKGESGGQIVHLDLVGSIDQNELNKISEDLGL